MLGWWLRMGRKVRPWVIAVGLCSGAFLAAGCPVYYGPPPISTVYGPAPSYVMPQPGAGEQCRDDLECQQANGPGWFCEPPVDPASSAWGTCHPSEE
ncbi:MAG: hypothetical protein HY907_21530 [Deltaproteobacteria bacterium]|nr:hypothetical protein [Deltaproteobacteria bacterium]